MGNVSDAETTMSIPTACQNLANAARIAVNRGGMTNDAALRLVCDDAIIEARAASARDGHWAAETSARAIEDALFLSAVARDIIDGTVTRPSTGNVRAYALGLVGGSQH